MARIKLLVVRKGQLGQLIAVDPPQARLACSNVRDAGLKVPRVRNSPYSPPDDLPWSAETSFSVAVPGLLLTSSLMTGGNYRGDPCER